jgi:hypothetical protein
MKIRPRVKRSLRALSGRRVVIEGFGRKAPSFVMIGGGGDTPASAWLAPAELRKLIETGKKILK